MSKLLIENASVVTVDQELGDFERANILIDDGAIVAIAPGLEADAERIDASGMIAMPGMVDTHLHTWQTPVRGILADGNIPDYLRGIRLQLADRMRPEDMYVGNYLGALDAINSGVTSIVDYCHNILSPEHAHSAVRGLLDAGVRGLYAHGMTPITTNTWAESKGGSAADGDPADYETRASLAREIRETYFRSENQLLRFGMAPQEFAITPPAEVVREFAFARELGARITQHANQVIVRQLFQDVEQLHAHGLLGDDLLLVHCTFNTEHEWELLRDTGTMVSVCAETEMQMGMGFPAIREATENTPGPSLGIDCVSGTSHDMISHGRLVLQATRWRDDEPGYQRMVAPQVMKWKTSDALQWLTINGAKAAGVGDVVGSLTPGKRADIVLLDMRGVSAAGWNSREPGGAIISQANAGNVDTVLIDGRIVKRDGRLVHVDVDEALRKMQDSHDYLYEEMDKHGGFIPQPPVDIPLYRERA